MIHETLDRLLKKNTLHHLGITREVPGFNIGVASLACILLLKQREDDLFDAEPDLADQHRYTSESLMDDLTDLGARVDETYVRALQQILTENVISVDDNDRYSIEKLALVVVKLYSLVYPTMPGLELVGWLTRVIDQVIAGEKDPDQAAVKVNQVLESEGVYVDLDQLSRGYQLGFRKLALAPPRDFSRKKIGRNLFKTVFDKQNQKRQETLERIGRAIREKGEMPVLSLNEKFLRQKIHHGFNSTSEVSDLCLNDLAICLMFLKEANNLSRKQVRTVSHALSLLGNESVQTIVDRFIIVDSIEDSRLRQELEHTYIAAYMSARISDYIARRMEIRDTEELMLAAMIHNLGQVLVLYYDTDAYFQIKKMTQKAVNKRKAARTVLGITFDAVGIHFAETWGLPFIQIESLRVCYFNRIGKTRDNLVINLPFCSTELSAFSGGVLDGRQTVRLRELINSLNMFSREISNLLDKAMGDVLTFSRKQKIDLNRRELAAIASTG